MRYAIFSDIHANRQAWGAALSDIHSTKPDVVVCLGDTVGYGPMPERVLSSVRNEVDIMLLGNHDAAAFGGIDLSIFNEEARAAVEWTTTQLSDSSIDYLKSLPLTTEKDGILFSHAELANPASWGYIDTLDEAKVNFAMSDNFISFVGHTHRPTIFDQNQLGKIREHPDRSVHLIEGHRYIVNVGSVGDPRNPEDLRGRYVIYEPETRTVYFRKFSFDHEMYRHDREAAKLDYKPYFLRMIDHEATQQGMPGAKR